MGWRRIAGAFLVPFWILAVSAPAIAETTCVYGLLCVETPAVQAPVLPSPEAVTQPVTNLLSPLAQQALNTPVSVLEAQLLNLINVDRVAGGLQPLQSVGWAQSVARGFSETMRAAGTIWHNPAYMSGGRKAMGADLLGENVGYDQSILMNHVGLMNSPSHRVNIMEARYTHVGIGIAVSADGSRVYVTEDFARIPGTPTAAAPAVAKPAAAKPASVNRATVQLADAPTVAQAAPAIETPTIALAAGSGIESRGASGGAQGTSKAADSDQMAPTSATGPLGTMMPGLAVGVALAVLSSFAVVLRRVVGLRGSRVVHAFD
ncbi:MAG: CAP domain-containing protein [Actinomycetota bacterium]